MGLKYFSEENFHAEMELFLVVLNHKGFVLESDHCYAYAMQYEKAFEDVKGWLNQHGYVGDLDNIGAYDGVAVYGLYDENVISYEQMMAELIGEANRQK